jgi:hypothetical protein
LNFDYTDQFLNQRLTVDIIFSVTCPTLEPIFPAVQLSLQPPSNGH